MTQPASSWRTWAAGVVTGGFAAVALVLPSPGAAAPAAEDASIATALPGVIAGSVSAGDFHSCAIRTNGTLACWGNNDDGQASPPAGTFTTVSAGGFHGCAVRTDGTLACWGGGGQSSLLPAGTFTAVSAGSAHATVSSPPPRYGWRSA